MKFIALSFLTPFAAFAIMRVLNPRQLDTNRITAMGRLRSLVFIGVIGFLFVIMNWIALQQHRIYQYSWPHSDKIVAFLESQNITESTQILGSAAAIYEYYLDMSPQVTRQIWTNIWNVRLSGLEGIGAIRAAVETCQFDIIITDNYYAPDLGTGTKAIVENSPNYNLVLVNYQMLANGFYVKTEVFTLREDQTCLDGEPRLNL